MRVISQFAAFPAFAFVPIFLFAEPAEIMPENV